ncbi:hypothetical protein SEPCBS119000_000836 [Sporothrix epigloea]|uniref:Pentatricopeptide repeat domain-containing protein n=1 Tax=Sporothrix epigloea TaxID=1892477 RepID=A0ABP0D8F3_9PEZI
MDLTEYLWTRPMGAGKPSQLVLGAEYYGKWRELIYDYDRLMFESGLASAVPLAEDTLRSVDRLENAGDPCLWSAIFNFAQRRGDIEGALAVWREIFQRRELHEVNGTVAVALWSSVLETALDASDESFLESTWAYAEWMYDVHGVLWPHYYRQVVRYFLDAGKYNQALQWHIRLSSHFALSKRAFFDLLMPYITDTNPALQETLRSIYVTSHHRPLYDTIVPLLWSRGHSKLAMDWRETLVWHNDLPSSSASRPFLHFVAGYYPDTELHPQEQNLASDENHQYIAAPIEPETKSPDLPTNMFHLMNRVHGETFGIEDKSTFNDNIGSKWFATTWVSLETAIKVLYSLGVTEIGPLSLQSIALRSGGPDRVIQSLKRLEQCEISIGSSNYSKAIRHLAKTGDAETLHELLHSKLHPDVFNDFVQQRHALGAAAYMGDWRTHRLVMVVRLAVSEDALISTASELLAIALQQRKKSLALRLLDEFHARGIEVTPMACRSMTDTVLRDVCGSFDPKLPPDVDFYAAFCRRLAAQRLPVPTVVWRKILLTYGRQGRLADFEKVALGIVEQYSSLQLAALRNASRLPSPPVSSSFPMTEVDQLFKVHVDDVPGIVRGNVERELDIGYRRLPQDLPLDHPTHPLSLIFSEDILQLTVRWYFHRKMALRQKQNARAIPGRRFKASGATSTAETRPAADKQALAKIRMAPPSSFYMAGGIRLLAMLRSRGVAVPRALVRREALICIAALYGPQSMTARYWYPARSMNQLKLVEVKAFCDAAWASGDFYKAQHDTTDADSNVREQYLLPPSKVLKNALGAVRQVSTSQNSQITRPSVAIKTAHDVFMDNISHEWPAA